MVQVTITDAMREKFGEILFEMEAPIEKLGPAVEEAGLTADYAEAVAKSQRFLTFLRCAVSKKITTVDVTDSAPKDVQPYPEEELADLKLKAHRAFAKNILALPADDPKRIETEAALKAAGDDAEEILWVVSHNLDDKLAYISTRMVWAKDALAKGLSTGAPAVRL